MQIPASNNGFRTVEVQAQSKRPLHAWVIQNHLNTFTNRQAHYSGFYFRGVKVLFYFNGWMSIQQ